MAKKIWIPLVAGGSALALVATAAIANALDKNDVTLVVDGVAQTIAVREDTVSEVLNLAGIQLGEHDVVLPAADSKVTEGLEINVAYGRPLELTVDGQTKTVWTTARTVDQALAYLNLDAPDSKYSASRSSGITREGLDLEIATAKDITLTVAGKPSKLTIAGTVADALAEAGVKPDADDTVTPAVDTPLTDGLAVTYVNVEVKSSTKVVEIPFAKTEVKSKTMEKGKEKVTTKGVAGAFRDTYTDVYHDGVLVSSTKASRVTSKQPVAEVTTVGTKEPVAETSSDGGGSNLTPAAGATCKASYYWQGQMTANGEQFNTNDFTAAHKTLKFGTRVKVTNKANGRTTVVRINDRGPYISGRCLDLSTAAMKAIGGTAAGVVTVTYEVVG